MRGSIIKYEQDGGNPKDRFSRDRVQLLSMNKMVHVRNVSHMLLYVFYGSQTIQMK